MFVLTWLGKVILAVVEIRSRILAEIVQYDEPATGRNID